MDIGHRCGDVPGAVCTRQDHLVVAQIGAAELRAAKAQLQRAAVICTARVYVRYREPGPALLIERQCQPTGFYHRFTVVCHMHLAGARSSSPVDIHYRQFRRIAPHTECRIDIYAPVKPVVVSIVRARIQVFGPKNSVAVVFGHQHHHRVTHRHGGHVADLVDHRDLPFCCAALSGSNFHFVNVTLRYQDAARGISRAPPVGKPCGSSQPDRFIFTKGSRAGRGDGHHRGCRGHHAHRTGVQIAAAR